MAAVSLGLEFPSCSSGHPKYPHENFRMTLDDWPLYSWTPEPFDSKKPSVLFFNGGPGQSSHGQDWTLEGWNVIYWDQRGVGCSKPNKEEQYYSQEFYSIEGTAKDARKILELYGLDEVSVLAVSYGTAPATVFAHLYPQQTRALVLEGTLFSGARDLHDLSHAQKILIRFFQELPKLEQDRMREWSKIPGITPTWFSRVGYYFLTLNDGLTKMRMFFERLIETGVLEASFFNNFGDRQFEDDPLGFSAVVFSAVACGELSQGIAGSTAGLVVSANELMITEDNSAKQLCSKYGFDRTKDFLAADYPLKKKVIYFQGVLDGATEATQAIEHFKTVPQANATLYLRVDGGHSPLLGEITDRYSNQPNLQVRYRDYLKSALLGIDPDVSAENSKVWKVTRRRSPDEICRSCSM